MAMALLAAPVLADEKMTGPSPPCGKAESSPAYPSIGAPPVIRTWSAANLANEPWTPPACTSWSPLREPGLVIALAGTFEQRGGMDALLARIGAISSLTQILYWSSTDKAWRPIALDAVALEGADSPNRRPDFLPREFGNGNTLYYSVNDGRTGPATYRMRVLERNASRLVLASENVSPVHFLFFTLFPPGTLQSLEFLDRTDDGIWHVYVLARVEGPMANWDWIWDLRAAAVNRSVALYRRLADIPSNQEPPALP